MVCLVSIVARIFTLLHHTIRFKSMLGMTREREGEGKWMMMMMGERGAHGEGKGGGSEGGRERERERGEVRCVCGLMVRRNECSGAIFGAVSC